MVDEGDIVRDTCLRGQVLEVGDVLLEAIVHDSVGAFERFLGELGEFETSGRFGVKGKESGFKVGGELIKSFLGVSNRVVRHFVIPHLGKRDSASLAHFVKRGHDLVCVRGVNRGVDGKVGLHGLDPSYSIGGFS